MVRQLLSAKTAGKLERVDDVASERSPRGADLERSEQDKTAAINNWLNSKNLRESLLTQDGDRTFGAAPAGRRCEELEKPQVKGVRYEKPTDCFLCCRSACDLGDNASACSRWWRGEWRRERQRRRIRRWGYDGSNRRRLKQRDEFAANAIHEQDPGQSGCKERRDYRKQH
jgi:hypothetical protein